MKTTVASLVLLIVFCGSGAAQQPPPLSGETIIQAGPSMAAQVVRDLNGPFYARPTGLGKWWKDSGLVKKIGLSDEQVQKIEKVFQGHRLDLIDLRADLEKQEVILEPMVDADQPDEAQVIAQIDKVAQARANLEKSDARMLFAMRRVLTLEQWQKLRDVPGIVVPFQHQPARPPAPGFPHPAPPASPPPPPSAAPPAGE